MINKEQITKEFRSAVYDMRHWKQDGTWHWDLHTDEKSRTWAIVLGWSDGYEKDDNDDCLDGTYRICAKLAYQPINSIMQCDYDIDWLMPMDEDGDVEDTECPIYPEDSLIFVVDWLLKEFNNNIKYWEKL